MAGNDWAKDAIIYHIYPLGLCGAPRRNDFHTPPVSRLRELYGWMEHAQGLGCNTILLGPVFESTSHGYDTVDLSAVDRRLGTNADLADLVAEAHRRGLRVLLDAVFNHTGRDHPIFRDLREHGPDSRYRTWYKGVDFSRTSPEGDPFSYEGWNGCYDLVKINTGDAEARHYLLDAARFWIREFRIDGLRIDAAQEIEPGFLAELASVCRSEREDFWLVGEAVGGDYRAWAHTGMLDAVTNYECYKGLYSSLNDRNYFEIAWSLNRQFGAEGLYRDLPLYAFVDNHDVPRAASILRDPALLYPLYALLFTMPGVPSVYYGSEWGIPGSKGADGDWPLRPRLCLEDAAKAPHPNLAKAIRTFAEIRSREPALRRGSYRSALVRHEQFAFERACEESRITVALNASERWAPLEIPALGEHRYIDLLDPPFQAADSGGVLRIDVPPRWVRMMKVL